MTWDDLLASARAFRDEAAAARRVSDERTRTALQAQLSETSDPTLRKALQRTLTGRQDVVDLLRDPVFRSCLDSKRAELGRVMDQAASLSQAELADESELAEATLDQAPAPAVPAEPPAQHVPAQRPGSTGPAP